MQALHMFVALLSPNRWNYGSKREKGGANMAEKVRKNINFPAETWEIVQNKVDSEGITETAAVIALVSGDGAEQAVRTAQDAAQDAIKRAQDAEAKLAMAQKDLKHARELLAIAQKQADDAEARIAQIKADADELRDAEREERARLMHLLENSQAVQIAQVHTHLSVWQRIKHALSGNDEVIVTNADIQK